MPRPHTLAEVAHRRNAGEDFSFLVREFLDEFYERVRRGKAAACITDEPERLPDLREHASLGAVGEHLARQWHLTIPTCELAGAIQGRNDFCEQHPLQLRLDGWLLRLVCSMSVSGMVTRIAIAGPVLRCSRERSV